MSEGLTEGQKAILNVIDTFTHQAGYPPTVRDVAANLGRSSPGSVHRALVKLREKGAVDWVDGISRTLHVIEGRDHG